MRFITIPFSEDIIAQALTFVSDHSIMVFPTRASCQLAKCRYQENWQFEEITWTTMEEFKQRISLQDLPPLEDDKRLLCLYQVMSFEEKEYFHIAGFQDIVDWGNHFFQLFQELREAGKAPDYIEHLIESSELTLRFWQEEHIARISSIASRYKAKIAEMGFNDLAFTSGIMQLNPSLTGSKLIFVNQYYYSEYEKEMIRICERNGNSVIVLYHGIEIESENSWKVQPLDPKEAWEKQTSKPELHIRQFENQTQAALGFLALDSIQERGDSAIVDSCFYQSEYSAFFNPDNFHFPASSTFTETSYYQFLEVFHKLLKANANTPGFVPLSIIIQHTTSEQIVHYFCPEWDGEEHRKMVQELFSLSKEEVLYLDIDPLKQFHENDKYRHVLDFGQRVFSLLKKIESISCVEDLIELTDDVLSPQKICSPEEMEFTDLNAQIWTSLANFSAIQQLGIVTDWMAIFGESGVGLGIWELWMQYLRPIRLHVLRKEPLKTTWEITNLLDARNRSFENLAFFNLVEGVLPRSPEPVWLFSEAQKKRLGLKTYQDIREWERYYFFRMILCAKRVFLFTHRKLETNIEPSSFVGELLQVLGTENLEETQTVYHIDSKELFKAWSRAYQARNPQEPDDAKMVDIRSEIDESFFILPSIPTQDVGIGREFKCSSYSLSQLVKNPFVWYLQCHRNLQPKKAEILETISPSLFGTLMHAFFADVLRSEKGYHESLDSLEQMFSNTRELKDILISLLSSAEFQYKIPKNYNADFLGGVICDCLVNSLSDFYTRFLKRSLANQAFFLIPEADKNSDYENQYKELIRVAIDGREYRIQIRGRADLRIETDNSKIILDFKTGSASVEQLIFYEWFYYLLEDSGLDEAVKSYFWMILDRRIDDKHQSSAKKRLDFQNRIEETLLDCLSQGYSLGRKAADRLQLRDVTRSDLYIFGGKNE